jgi:hypothetical protein
MFYKKLFISLALIGTSSLISAQNLFPHDKAMSKIFPFLDGLQNSSVTARQIEESHELQAMTLNHQQRIAAAREGCQPLPQCWVDALMLNEEEIQMASEVLVTLQREKKLGSFVQHSLRNSGFYNLYKHLPDEELIAKVWMESAKGLNNILRVYALADKPRYPEIDSTSIDPNSMRGRGLLMELIHQPDLVNGKFFFSSTLTAAQYLLYLDERENAGYFPNLDTKDNRLAAIRAKRINWSLYPYSAILILGDGPDTPGMSLGQFGKLRIRQAVSLFKERKAPFIVVSGGFVHPARTTMNEALEMKKELIKRYDIEEQAIIIEPFARHTTTNFRNAVRLMHRYHFPLTKPALVTSSKFHIDYCLSEEFTNRQLKELDYEAIQWGNRTDPVALEFYPSTNSLTVNAMDPLDP